MGRADVSPREPPRISSVGGARCLRSELIDIRRVVASYSPCRTLDLIPFGGTTHGSYRFHPALREEDLNMPADRINRREFMQRSALTGAALGVALNEANAGVPPRVAANDRITVGMIGVGAR